MIRTAQKLPWFPSAAGSVVIHAAFAALAIGALPQIQPQPPETRISIAPLDAANAGRIQPDRSLEAVAPPQGQAPAARAEQSPAAPVGSDAAASALVSSEVAGGPEPDEVAPLPGEAPAASSVAQEGSPGAVAPRAASGLPPAAAVEQSSSAIADQVAVAELSPETNEQVAAAAPASQQPDPVSPSEAAAPMTVAPEARGVAPSQADRVAISQLSPRDGGLAAAGASPQQMAIPIAQETESVPFLPVPALAPLDPARIADAADPAAPIAPNDSGERTASELAQGPAAAAAPSDVAQAALNDRMAVPPAPLQGAALAAPEQEASSVAGQGPAAAVAPGLASAPLDQDDAQLLAAERSASPLPSVAGAPAPDIDRAAPSTLVAAADAIAAEARAQANVAQAVPEPVAPVDAAPLDAPGSAGAVAPDAASTPASDVAAAPIAPETQAQSGLPPSVAAIADVPATAQSPVSASAALAQGISESPLTQAVPAGSAAAVAADAVASAPAAPQELAPGRTITVQFARTALDTPGTVATPLAPSVTASGVASEETAVAEVVGGNAFGSDASTQSTSAPAPGQGVAAPAPEPARIVAQPGAEATPRQVAELVMDYADEACFAATVRSGADGLPRVRSYGREPVLGDFAADVQGEFGPAVQVETIGVTEGQCAVLQAMTDWAGYPAVGAALELSASQVASGGTVTASVPSTPGDWVYLLLIDEDGVARKLADYVSGEEETTRAAPPAQVAGADNAPQLIASVVSPTSLTSVAGDVQRPAQDVFAALQEELALRRIRASLSVTAFSVQ